MYPLPYYSQVLVSGSVIATGKADLLEVGQAAEALGIVLKDRQIGYRKKNSGDVTKTKLIREQVAISGDKVSFRKETFESTQEIKSEPLVMEEENEGDNLESSKPGDDNRSKPKKKKKRNSKDDLNESGSFEDKTCGQCGKSFPSSARLNLHMNVHKEEKPFKCEQCDKGFSAPASLKNHKLLHTGETFKCEFCEYSAVQKGNLKSHRLKVHRDLLDKNDTEEKANGEEFDNAENTSTENIKELPIGEDFVDKANAEETTENILSEPLEED